MAEVSSTKPNAMRYPTQPGTASWGQFLLTRSRDAARDLSCCVIALTCSRVRRCDRDPTAASIRRRAGAHAQLWIDPGRDAARPVLGDRRPESTRRTRRRVHSSRRGTIAASAPVTTSTAPTASNGARRSAPKRRPKSCVSRILWGLGYHQPPIYYLPSWTLDRAAPGHKRESEARFRPKLPRLRHLKSTGAGRQPVPRHARVQRHAGRPADVEQHRSEGRQQRHLSS